MRDDLAAIQPISCQSPFCSLAVSLSIFTASMSSLFWATYSGFCTWPYSIHLLVTYASYADGRRPIYLLSLPFLCLGSLGVANAQNVPELMIFRVVQAFGSSAGMSVGSGAIADIYQLEERGTAMGVFFAVSPVFISTTKQAINCFRPVSLVPLLLHSREEWPHITLRGGTCTMLCS